MDSLLEDCAAKPKSMSTQTRHMESRRRYSLLLPSPTNTMAMKLITSFSLFSAAMLLMYLISVGERGLVFFHQWYHLEWYRHSVTHRQTRSLIMGGIAVSGAVFLLSLVLTGWTGVALILTPALLLMALTRSLSPLASLVPLATTAYRSIVRTV